MISTIFSFIRAVFVRLVKFSIKMEIINFVLSFVGPYIQAIIYHIIVGPKLIFGPYIHPSTLAFITKIIGLFLVWRLLKFIIKNF